MLRRKLLSVVVGASILTIAGVSFSTNNPVTGPVKMMDFDQTVSVVLGMPGGVPPVTSFKLEHDTVYEQAALNLYPPSPCLGAAQIWNEVVVAHHMSHEDKREFLGIVLKVMAQDECAAKMTRDTNVSPPTVDKIQPIPHT
jgi:hypothetical protein